MTAPGLRPILNIRFSSPPAVLDRVDDLLPRNFPAAMADSILAGVRRSATQLAAELAV